MRRVGIFAVLALVSLVWYLERRPLPHPAGVLVPEAPRQTELRGDAPQFLRAGATLTAVASFDIDARVLSREDYWFDASAKLVPTDLALGWGRMSDSAVLDRVDIAQFGRFYYWHVQEFPIPEREIIESSANMHLIPADRSVERSLGRVRAGDLVHIRGYLVNAHMPDGGEWRTSTTRSDSGAGACELVWVEDLEIAPRR